MNLWTTLFNYAVWVIALAYSSRKIFFWLPPDVNLDVLKFAVSFFAFAFFLTVSCWGIGYFVRTKIIKAKLSSVDIALGLGILSFILNIYIKATISPWPFTVFLGGWFLYGVYSLYLEVKVRRGFYTGFLKSAECALIVSTVLLILAAVSLNMSSGFLYFPTDFDSGLFHVSFPKAVINRGYYFNPDWLRVPWHPQLTHNWYIYILGISSDMFLKCLNVVCFIQIVILFIHRSGSINRLLGLLLLVLLANCPEFRNNFVTTSLDSMLVVFTMSAFAVLFRFLEAEEKDRIGLLVIMTCLCGFSGGQKHFGLMFSAPLLSAACLYYIFKPGRNFKATCRVTLHALSLAILFCFVFVPFYIHNLFEGASLLFPFFGVTNNYGWDSSDLKQMLEDTIPHWGHSKDFLGFFRIPYDLLKYPLEYQFSLSYSLNDFVLSVQLCLVFALLIVASIWPSLRKAKLIVPAIVILLQLFGWYRGSQVIRYLFPLLIASSYYISQCFLPFISIIPRKITVMVFLSLIISQDYFLNPKASLPIPITREDREIWLTKYASHTIPAYQWLRANVGAGERILHMGEVGISHNFSQLVLCGDWFAKYRFDKFLNGYSNIKFKEWSELRPLFVSSNLSYILVTWNYFDATTTRPSSENNWGGAFPPSTAACVEHAASDGYMIDIFRVKKECLDSPSPLS